MYDTEVHNSSITNKAMCSGNAQTLPEENHKIIFKIRIVNGEYRLILKAIK